MRLIQTILRRAVIIVSLALLLLSCGQNQNFEALGLGSALVQVPLQERRIAIVHSQSSKTHFYDSFAYNQLFAAMQHQSMMAGIPFDLLDETELAVSADLLQYDAIVMPALSHVNAANRPLISSRLLAAQENGVGIITSGEFMGYKEDGTSFTDFGGALAEVFGVQASAYLNGVSASVGVANNSHPITRTYEPDEELKAYDQIWFAHFVPAAGEQSTALTVVEADGASYHGAQVIERPSRVVHFSNEQIMADNNLLWRVIQWVVYGEVAPVALQLSRSDHIFLARNDMDQAMIAADLAQTEIPLLAIIDKWKRDYNFVGSYYLDIGNNPLIGQYTDWSVSAPLYQSYIDLGNEIGTHSWTHPHYTSTLTAQELEFEFKDSAAKIGNEIGVPVKGAAIPGTSESLFVVETLNPWLDYLSGREGVAGSGYPGAFGFLEPQHNMMYFSLNMSADFGLIDFQNKTPAQATDIWKEEIDVALKHAHQPIVHWLWHDYGPTTQTAAGLYTKEMFSDTIEYAASKGAEFATVEDMNRRMLSFADLDLSVGSSDVITASVNATGVGQFALKVSEVAKIKSVRDWYAYDEDQVFLPENGGEFVISVGEVPDSVTRISALPMRARLMSLTGDKHQLNFSMQGEGEVTIVLSDAMVQNNTVTGADSFTEDNGALTLKFNSFGNHVVEIAPIDPINVAPVANAGAVDIETAVATPITLTGSDEDGDTLSFAVLTQPLNGILTGTAPNLTYTSNPGFSGSDGFSYSVSDGDQDSTPAKIELLVQSVPAQNSRPLANELVLETLIDQPLTLQLSGSDNEAQGLTYSVTVAPANGTLSGTAPNFIYTPNAGYTGRDSLEYVVNDWQQSSTPATVVINVESNLGQVTGTVSNLLNTVSVNGDLSEWSSLSSFDTDPQDVSGVNNELDWQRAWMAHDNTNFFIAYSEHGDAQITWGNQIYLDTDTNASTGFRGFANELTIGADYVIEGDALFRYNSELQNGWNWDFVGAVESAQGADGVELKVPREQLGDPANVLLFFYANNAATSGNAIDYYPDNASDAEAVLRTRRFSYSVNPNVVADNFAPVAFSQRVKISNDASFPLTLTGFDQDGDALDFTIDVMPQSGTLTGTAPNLVYTPNAGASQDVLTFRVSDGIMHSNSRTVEFLMQPPPAVNNRPAVSNQTLDVQLGTSVPVTLIGNDVDGDSLVYAVVNQPLTGSLTGTVPNLIYAPAAVVGTDSFTYVAADSTTQSALATVTINIVPAVPVNVPPVAENLNLSTDFETATGVALLASDSDEDQLTYNILTQPVLGALSGTPPQLTYLPFNGATGSDSFTFSVNDGVADSAVATVVIDVLPEVLVNQMPVANSQSVSTAFGQASNITLSGRDPEQDVLIFNVLTQSQGGVLSGTAPGLVYSPEAGFTGADSFTFNVNDGELDSTSATVIINVGEEPSDVISNPVSGLTVDAALADWSGLQALGSDAADIGGIGAQNPLDWREAWVAHSPTDLYIAYRNHEAVGLSWGHGIYVDTDGDINTGFRGFYGEFPIGADYLIETDDVQQYTGTGSNWAWLTISQAEVANSGAISELSFPLNAIGNPTGLRFFLKADNAAFGGSIVDYFPDAANDATAPPSERYLPYQLTP